MNAPWAFLLGLGSACLLGTEGRAAETGVDKEPANRIGLSYRAGFGITAKFSGSGGFVGSGPGPAAGGGVDRNYDDGYNRVDGSGNAGGLTWNWGYGDASQAPPGADMLLFHSSSSAGTAVSDDQGDDPESGFELTYERLLGHVGKCRWGAQLVFGYMGVGIRDSSSLLGSVSRITDIYALGGITPPVAPYEGMRDAPGPLIPDAPLVRTTEPVAGGAVIEGTRRLDATLLNWRMGPYLELPLSRRVSCGLGAGLSAVYVASDFEYTESVTIAGSGTQSSRGSGRDSDVLFGGYVSGSVHWQLGRVLGVFAGVQYQNAGSFSQAVGGREAELDLGSSIFVSAGVSASF